MPLTDSILEIVLSYLLDSPSAMIENRVYVARPVCRLLATRRTRGFEHVKMELLRLGLRWAMAAKDKYKRRAAILNDQLTHERELMTAYHNMHWEADRIRIDMDRGRGMWEIRDFMDDRPDDDAFRGD